MAIQGKIVDGVSLQCVTDWWIFALRPTNCASSLKSVTTSNADSKASDLFKHVRLADDRTGGKTAGDPKQTNVLGLEPLDPLRRLYRGNDGAKSAELKSDRLTAGACENTQELRSFELGWDE
ncbi:MAG: hypothetical protein Aurels2KO_17040 [Aureliella sp.]